MEHSQAIAKRRRYDLNGNKNREAAMKYAKATLAIEGLIVSKEEEKLVRDALDEKMTHEEFIRLAKELAERSGKE